MVPLGRLRRRAVPPEREPPLGAGHGRVVQLVRRADRWHRPLFAGGVRRGEGPRGRGRGRGRGRRRRLRGAAEGEGAEPRRRRGRGARGGARGGGGGGEVRAGGAGEEDAEFGRVEERHGVRRLEWASPVSFGFAGFGFYHPLPRVGVFA